jgi:lysyl-tRNA synthetase, class II
MAYANLDTLVSITENLLLNLRDSAEAYFEDVSYLGEWTRPFSVINFIPTLEAEIQQLLPGFVFPRALSPTPPDELLHVCQKCNIPLQEENPSTARILDLLAGKFLEPLTKESPTFIAHHPSITTPLSKSFVDSAGHEVAARMELFVNGIEYANFYEEENDPLAQMKKFIKQGYGRYDNLDCLSYSELFGRLTAAQQYYVRVMEMGMPPTAGWGAGIDRLTMLFSGAERISNVLPFGNLRHVLAMGVDEA